MVVVGQLPAEGEAERGNFHREWTGLFNCDSRGEIFNWDFREVDRLATREFCDFFTRVNRVCSIVSSYKGILCIY